nr:MAG TPA_asm: hypothetical protein [Caudoviricetes sp.]DAV04339.1 MAG TPA: hypothetical protein [Caudoviricetes sp.]
MNESVVLLLHPVVQVIAYSASHSQSRLRCSQSHYPGCVRIWIVRSLLSVIHWSFPVTQRQA